MLEIFGFLILDEYLMVLFCRYCTECDAYFKSFCTFVDGWRNLSKDI